MGIKGWRSRAKTTSSFGARCGLRLGIPNREVWHLTAKPHLALEHTGSIKGCGDQGPNFEVKAYPASARRRGVVPPGP